MNKISLIVMIKGEVKTGKSHLAMTAPDSIMVDLTHDSNAKAAAFNVYGEEFEERYYKVDDYVELEKIVEETEAKSVCIDESKNLRDIYAKKFLVENKKKKVFPISEWGGIYEDIQERLFRKYDGKKNFMITGGVKDRRVFDKDSKTEVVTGQRVADGLNILPTVADVILHVEVNESKKGSPPKMTRSRNIIVIRNRFLDIANEEVWVEHVSSIEELIEKICENSKFEKEMFVI